MDFLEYHRIATRFLRNKLARHLPIDSPERVDGPRYLVCYTTPRNGSCTLLCRRLDGFSRCPNPGSGALGRASDLRYFRNSTQAGPATLDISEIPLKINSNPILLLTDANISSNLLQKMGADKS